METPGDMVLSLTCSPLHPSAQHYPQLIAGTQQIGVEWTNGMNERSKKGFWELWSTIQSEGQGEELNTDQTCTIYRIDSFT